MANDIQIFSNPQFGEIRTLADDANEPMFCAKDVATALGYADTADAISRHCKSGKKVFHPHANGIGGVNMVFITEKDVYRLIMRSNLPDAEKFQDWVCDEVLPTIRKHGAYMTQDVIERTLQDPDYLIRLATTLKEEKQKRIEAESVAAKRGLIIAEQQKELTEAAPKVEYHDKVLSSQGFLTVNMIAASIGISDRKLNKLLCEWGVQYKESGSYQLYAPYRGKGYAKQIPYPYRDSMNQIKTKQHLYWTEAGKTFIIELYEKKSA